MCNHCGCGSGWSQPVIPAPLEGITSYTAPFAGAIARPFASKLSDRMSSADFGFSPSNTPAGNVAAWNAMIAAASAAGGAQIEILPGTYQVNAPLVIDSRQNIHVLGSGPARQSNVAGTKIVQATAGASVIRIQHSMGCSVRDLALTYAVDASAGVPALHLLDTFDCEIEGVGINDNGLGANPAVGISVQRDGAASPMGPQTFLTRILHCQVGNCTGNGMQFLGTDAAHFTSEAWVQGCLLIGCGGAGIYCGDYVEGVYINAATDFSACQRGIFLNGSSLLANLRNIILSGGCVVDSSTLENIRVTFATNVQIKGSWVATTGATESIAIENSAGVQVQGCFISGGSINGIKVDNTPSTVISGNVFANNGVRSIHLGAGTIDSRVISNATPNDPGAILDEGTVNVIGPNLLTGGLHYLSDLNFYANLTIGSPTIAFDPNDFLTYSRVSNSLSLIIGGILQCQLAAGGANDTSLILRDESAGTTKRVSLGAADSGGSGFKVLRIAN